jgi:hypothetical protein
LNSSISEISVKISEVIVMVFVKIITPEYSPNNTHFVNPLNHPITSNNIPLCILFIGI